MEHSEFQAIPAFPPAPTANANLPTNPPPPGFQPPPFYIHNQRYQKYTVEDHTTTVPSAVECPGPAPAVCYPGAALSGSYPSNTAYCGPGQPVSAVLDAAPTKGSGQVVVIEQPAGGGSPRSSTEANRYTCHLVVACLVFWFCGCLFGGIAFLLAVIAHSRASNGDHKSARPFGRASCVLSFIGMFLGLVVWGFVVWWLLVNLLWIHDDDSDDGDDDFSSTTRSSSFLPSTGVLGSTTLLSSTHLPSSQTPECNYICEGACYKYRLYMYTGYQCLYQFRNSCYSSETRYCYYNY